MPTWKRGRFGITCFINLTTLGINQDGVLCVALEVGQESTGRCCIVHCIHHQRASLRLVVNSNKVNTCEQTLTSPLPWNSDTCVVCSDFSSHCNWCGYICTMIVPTSSSCNWIPPCTQFLYLQQAVALGCYSDAGSRVQWHSLWCSSEYHTGGQSEWLQSVW